MRGSASTLCLLSLALLFEQSAWPSSRANSEIHTSALYGQGFEFWSKVNAIRNRVDNIPELLRLLDDSFDRPQEGIASLAIRYQGPIENQFWGLIDQAYFGAGADAIAGGVARNRILPTIEAYESLTGHIDFGVSKELKPSAGGWDYSMGSTFGAGQQRLLKDSAIELAGNFVPTETFVFYSGIDSHLGYQNRFSESLNARYRFSLQPTLFHTDYSASGSRYLLQSDQLTLRWREQSEWDLTIDTGYEPLIDVGAHTIVGQQPLPIPLLPRTWDSVHELSVWPAFGQLVGLGSRIRLYSSRGTLGATLYGGFYGGYLGCSAHLQIYGLDLSAGTYGIEQKSGYRIDESRINFVSLGGHLAF